MICEINNLTLVVVGLCIVGWSTMLGIIFFANRVFFLEENLKVFHSCGDLFDNSNDLGYLEEEDSYEHQYFYVGMSCEHGQICHN